jgi:hypothetical protein
MALRAKSASSRTSACELLIASSICIKLANAYHELVVLAPGAWSPSCIASACLYMEAARGQFDKPRVSCTSIITTCHRLDVFFLVARQFKGAFKTLLNGVMA